MYELTSETALAYLAARGRGYDEPIEVRELLGGVSNVVLLVTLPERGERFVLKQARGRLRVKEEWLCPVERIWREALTLRICGELLAKLRIANCGLRNEGQSPPPTSIMAAFQPCVPEVLWEDRENYCFAMRAAPEGHQTWKELLLAGELPLSLGIAAACGQMLAALHGGSWGNAEIAGRLDDRTFFDQLRIDPYYRQVAKVHPDLAPQIQSLIDSVWSHRQCLVHGDFSPKNLLVWQGSRLAPRDESITRSVMPALGQVMLIDFEVGHYGDPAFDLGFFLTHLVLKAIRSRTKRDGYLRLATVFWNTYRAGLTGKASAHEIDDLERRAMGNLAGCMLARVDGKSPVEYLSNADRDVVRVLSRSWIERPHLTVNDVVAQLAGRT